MLRNEPEWKPRGEGGTRLARCLSARALFARSPSRLAHEHLRTEIYLSSVLKTRYRAKTRIHFYSTVKIPLRTLVVVVIFEICRLLFIQLIIYKSFTNPFFQYSNPDASDDVYFFIKSWFWVNIIINWYRQIYKMSINKKNIMFRRLTST